MFENGVNTVNYNAAPNSALFPTVKIGIYLCPSGQVQESQQGGTGNTGPTIHYPAVMGAKGANSFSGAAYPVVNATTTHGGFASNGMMFPNSRIRLTGIEDGTSNTFLIGELSFENANCFRNWARGWDGNSTNTGKNIVNPLNSTPYNGSNLFNDVSFGSGHTGGANFLMGDGSVRFVRDTIAMPAYLAAASRNGGEAIGLD